MKRETLLAAAVAVLGVVAVAIAAATLEDRWYPEEGTDGSGSGGEPPGAQPPPIEPNGGLEIPYLDQIVMILLLAVVLIAVIYLIKNHREYIPLLLGLVVLAGLLMLVVQWIDLPADPIDQQQPQDWIPGDGGDNGESPPPEGQIDWLPVAAVLAVLGLVLVAAIAMSVRSGGPGITADAAADETDGTSPVAADLGEAAGRAADRIEASEGYENEVYRAWAEMTDLLDLPNPEVATPGDFAAEAVDAGLEPTDIRDLTRLFEAVRYGNRSPTADRERRAVTLLRRIENRYAETE